MPAPYTVLKDNASLASAQTTVTAGARLQLSSVSTPTAKVFISTPLGNQGTVTIGGATVVAASSGHSGADLAPGAGYTLEIDDLSKVYFDGTNSGDTISFAYLA